MSKYLYAFAEGGKLAEMTDSGLPVPPGFFHHDGLDHVSSAPFRVPVRRETGRTALEV